MMRKTGMTVCRLVGGGGDRGRTIARLLNHAGLGNTPTPTDVELPAATTFFKNLGAFHLSPPSCSAGLSSSAGRAQTTLPQRAHETFFTRPICISSIAFAGEEDEVDERALASRKRVAMWRSSRVSWAW
jgi:hypothetical protein